MTKQQNADKCFNTIMELQGVDEFKAMVQRLRIFQQNKEKYSVSDVSLPNYLWVLPRGSDVSLLVKVLTEFLCEERMFVFRGNEKFLEFDLAYVSPDDSFTELDILDGAIKDAAGRRYEFKGVLCIHIDAWLGHMQEVHFKHILDYIEKKRGKLLTVFSVCNCDDSTATQIESALSPYVCIEIIKFGFPKAEELAELIDVEFMKPKGFTLANDAKKSLTDSIKRLSNEANFNGHKSIKRFAEGIILNILSSETCLSLITAETLEICGKISEQERFIKTRDSITRGSKTRKIGFVHEALVK